MSSDKKCPKCNQDSYKYGWCKPYKFIQDAQLNADRNWEVIEWIPYDRFKDVKQIDIENQQYQDKDEVGVEVALKKFGNFVNFNDVLNEMEIHFKTWQFYGITRDPETHSYMMLMNIHRLDIVHQDFRPGKILSYNFKSDLRISDFGLSKLIGVNPNNPEKKNIFGVLPYIAPEVLSGDEEYTKAANIYSFGIIAYEMITGFPPYPDIPHDEDLAIKICNGLRPKIPFHTPKLTTRMIMRCWDARVTHRPTFEELFDELWEYYNDYRDYLDEEENKDSEIGIQIKIAEEFLANQESTNTTTTTPLNYQTHPQAIYTSRLLNYSKLSKPKNEENFERKLEELTKSFSHITTKVLSGDEEYTKAANIYSFGIIAYEMITGFPPYPDIPHDEDLAIKICNGLRPKIPFHTPKLTTRMIMRCWDARVTHRPTFEELFDELWEYYNDYRDYLDEEENKDSEIGIQIKIAEEFLANQESTNTTTTTPLNYQTHPQAIYTSRLLNYSKLSKPKNEENFERKLEELTKSFSHITTNDIDEF
ncbi:hypothetical protein Glove_97g101 [Diversispora epigaea]|uniref:Protein kinase domain-containing protein n=1 Tax=Diversispora epigaea TaxID=1348612 RepID=A0A397JEE9_9GLOM|nr:hypothetical protein Glove_97g101 [Diversispora epigaea]